MEIKLEIGLVKIEFNLRKILLFMFNGWPFVYDYVYF
jgi:hypothetical protein